MQKLAQAKRRTHSIKFKFEIVKQAQSKFKLIKYGAISCLNSSKEGAVSYTSQTKYKANFIVRVAKYKAIPKAGTIRLSRRVQLFEKFE